MRVEVPRDVDRPSDRTERALIELSARLCVSVSVCVSGSICVSVRVCV